MNPQNFMVNKFLSKEKAKQKKMLEARKCFEVNMELKMLLQRVKHSIDKENYKAVVKKLRKYNSNCDFWNITYRNHLEDVNVALAQAVLIQSIIKSTDTTKNQYIQTTVHSLIQRLNLIDATTYRKYRYELNAIQKHLPLIRFKTDIDKTVELSLAEFRNEAKGMINFALNEKGYSLTEIDEKMIAEDITGIEGNHNLSEEAMRIINEELDSIRK